MAPKRYEVITSRRTARGSSYVVYDTVESRRLEETVTRDKKVAEAEAKRLNTQ